MAKTLGAVTLPAQIFWKNRWQKTGRIFTPLVDISQTTNTHFVVEQSVGTTGRTIEIACESTGDNAFNDLFFSTSNAIPYYGTVCTVESIQNLANTGGNLTLVWDSETYTVRFTEYPQFEPVLVHSLVTEEKYNAYIGAIKLITV
jgi:hypothetical protein